MATDYLHCTTDNSGRATLTLDRPKVHNAFDDVLITELTEALISLDADDQTRVLVLAATGKNFSAGADLAWMRRMADYSEEENYRDSMALAELMKTLNNFSKPTIALAQGATFGGGVGLLAACDMVLATHDASFCFSEVRLGLIPAVISPYVVAAIGARAARRYFQTAEQFDVETARALGLVHEICAAGELEAKAGSLCRLLLQNGPRAMAAAKTLVADIASTPLDDDLVEETAQRIAKARSSEEGREGLSAFLEKRPPNWNLK